MSLLKKVMFVVVALVLFGQVSTFAQRSGKGKPNLEERAQRITTKMTAKFDLSAQQSEQIKAIHLKYGEQMLSLRSEMKGKREEAKAAAKEIHTAKQAELKTVLTPEQYQEYEAAWAKMEKRRGARRGGHRGEHRGSRG